MVATVEDGRVTRLAGDPEHPVTQGFLCYRTNKFLERQYDPDRLTQPLLRRDGELVPVGWDEALDHVGATLLRVRQESGPASILHYRSGGSLGLMKHVTDYFFEQFGPVAIKSGDICSGAGDVAQETDFGDEDAHDLFDLYNSRTILIWGKNPYVSNVHLLPVLREARRRGIRLAMIDPVRHRGADLCGLTVQPRPGGDIALAAAMIRECFQRGLHDPELQRYCDHVDALREAVLQRSTEAWASLADVPAEAVHQLVDWYTDGPAAILVGWGMQRRVHGSATIRMLDALCAVTGNVGVPGGGCSFYMKRRGAFDLGFSRGLEIAPRSIPEPLLGPGILEARDPEIRVVWVTCGNPVAMLPESATVAQALRSREMTVVVDAFLTDSAACADVVLPTTTMLEDDDLVGAYGHHYLGNVRPVVDPPEGVLSDYGIVQALAPRVGLNGDFGRSVREWKEQLLGRVAPAGASLQALERGAVRNPEAAHVLFADRRFPTASGRINLIQTFDPEPPRPTPRRPLLLTAISTPKSQGSQTRASAQQATIECTVHPDAAVGIADGEEAWLESEIGRMRVRVRWDARQRQDMALLPKGGWLSRGRCANALIRARATDAGGGACYYDEPVRLLPLDELD